MTTLPSFPEIVELYKELKVRERAWHEPVRHGYGATPGCDLLESVLKKNESQAIALLETLFGPNTAPARLAAAKNMCGLNQQEWQTLLDTISSTDFHPLRESIKSLPSLHEIQDRLATAQELYRIHRVSDANDIFQVAEARAINIIEVEATRTRIPRINLIVREQGPLAKLWANFASGATSLKSRFFGSRSSELPTMQAVEEIGLEEIAEAPHGINKNAIIGTGIALAGSWAAYELLRSRHDNDKTISR